MDKKMLLAFAACSISGCDQPTEIRPSSELLNELESNLQLPEMAYTLDQYNREYTFGACEGKPVVVGAYEHIRKGAASGVRTSVARDQFKGSPADGGCGIVRLYYDPAAKKIDYVACGAEG